MSNGRHLYSTGSHLRNKLAEFDDLCIQRGVFKGAEFKNKGFRPIGDMRVGDLVKVKVKTSIQIQHKLDSSDVKSSFNAIEFTCYCTLDFPW